MKMKTLPSFSRSHFRARSLSRTLSPLVSLSVCCAGAYFQLSDVHEACRCALQLVLLRRQLRLGVALVLSCAACCLLPQRILLSSLRILVESCTRYGRRRRPPHKQHKLNTATTINSNNCCLQQQQQQQHRERLLPPAKYLKLFWAKHKRNSRRGAPKKFEKSSKQKRRVLPLGVCESVY